MSAVSTVYKSLRLPERFYIDGGFRILLLKFMTHAIIFYKALALK